jgi:hypothetical protein
MLTNVKEWSEPLTALRMDPSMPCLGFLYFLLRVICSLVAVLIILLLHF